MNPASDALEKIRQQFDYVPYPNLPLEEKVKRFAYFEHSLLTPYYLRYQKTLSPEGKVILDAGCGTGFKAMCLAEANPGARVIGIDISEESVRLARLRLEYHGIENAEFHTLPIETLPQWAKAQGLQFDYINCDEVLYLLPDPLAALQAFQAVLTPEGIIRGNFHSLYHRIIQFRCQELFRMMGLMDSNPTEFEADVVREIFRGFRKTVKLKNQCYRKELDDDTIFRNYLLQSDRGFTLEEVFNLLAAANLQLISMVNWKSWSVWDLLENPEDPPAAWAMSLGMASLEEQLRMYELVNPVHRLLDFWCGHPYEPTWTPVSDWDEAEWQGAIATLHPFTKTEQRKEQMIETMRRMVPLQVDRFPVSQEKTLIDSGMVPCFLALWDAPQPVSVVVERYLQLNPVNPRTLEPLTRDRAELLVRGFLAAQCEYGLVLLEPGSRQ
jgi:ubiquinone/menaquinone biosynthesis C-methylase UbiE